MFKHQQVLLQLGLVWGGLFDTDRDHTDVGRYERTARRHEQTRRPLRPDAEERNPLR